MTTRSTATRHRPGFVEPFYNCYVSYFGTCGDPRQQYTNDSEQDRMTFEIHTSDPRFRYMVGYYSVEVENYSDNEWHVLGLAETPQAAVDAPDIYWTTDVRDLRRPDLW